MNRVFDRLIFDVKSSKRERLPNGYLRVSDSNLTRSQVSKYLGSELGDVSDMGWDAGKPYNLLRAADELEKAVGKYNGLPLLMGHHDGLPKEQIIGTVGTEASFDGDFVKNSLTVWDTAAIAAIERGEIEELSAGYSHTIDPTPGEFNGEKYDGVMRDIEPNHVALVDRGRAGREVRVADSDVVRSNRGADKPLGNPTGDSAGNNKETCMSKKTLSPLAYRVAGAVEAHLRHHKAADTAGVLDLVANVEPKRFAKQIEGIVGTVKDKFKVEASDELRGILKDMEAMPEIPADDEFPPKKEDEDPEMSEDEYTSMKKKMDAYEAKKKKDEFPPKKEDEFPPKEEMAKEMKKAGDQLRAEFRDLREAEKVVRPFVGDVDGCETAAEVYRFALDHLGVDVKDVHPSAYKAMVQMAGSHKAKTVDAAPVDAQSTYERFPALAHLRRVM